MRSEVHLLLHAAVPAALAMLASPGRRLRTWAILMAGLVVDVDHLLADPVYDPGRCSLGFHPLHSYPAIAGYGLLAIWPRLRLLAAGLLLHMLLDGIDCLWMSCESNA